VDFIVFTAIDFAMPCTFELVAVGTAAAESFFQPRGGMLFGCFDPVNLFFFLNLKVFIKE